MTRPLRLLVFYPNLAMVEVMAFTSRELSAALIMQQVFEYVRGRPAQLVDYS